MFYGNMIYLPIIMLDIEGRDENEGWHVPSKPLKSLIRNSASFSKPFNFVPMLSTETVEQTKRINVVNEIFK